MEGANQIADMVVTAARAAVPGAVDIHLRNRRMACKVYAFGKKVLKVSKSISVCCPANPEFSALTIPKLGFTSEDLLASMWFL